MVMIYHVRKLITKNKREVTEEAVTDMNKKRMCFKAIEGTDQCECKYSAAGALNKTCLDCKWSNPEESRNIKPQKAICIVCGREFEKHTWNINTCSSTCKGIRDKQVAKEYRTKKREENKVANQKQPGRKKHSKLSISDVAVMARERGLTYGEMTAIMEGRTR